jgi:hypothetical protein
MTYMELILEAFEHFGGKATAPDICKFVEETHPEQIKNKTKTWRNSISGQLSTHFEKDMTATGRTTVWLFNGEHPPKRKEGEGKRSKSYDPNVVVVVEKKKKSTKTEFDYERLEELLELYPDTIEREVASIELINKDHPLKLIQKLPQPGTHRYFA